MLLGNLADKVRKTRPAECENDKDDNAEKSIVEGVKLPDQVGTISNLTEDKDIDKPSETQTMVVAPAREEQQCAWTLARCYLWLTNKNISERKSVMFKTPRPFQDLVNQNLLSEVPDQALPFA